MVPGHKVYRYSCQRLELSDSKIWLSQLSLIIYLWNLISRTEADMSYKAKATIIPQQEAFYRWVIIKLAAIAKERAKDGVQSSSQSFAQLQECGCCYLLASSLDRDEVEPENDRDTWIARVERLNINSPIMKRPSGNHPV
ncbi:RNA methylase family protein [Aspergillus luchuensis]|uniref:RNA methylase family protein n=1 Tax=Aspergillus kawachii TaxID=1069201 RepID=A0A146FCM3_ASPKA|nr:RNA methylase family protein [Aspergillus luchuensis]